VSLPPTCRIDACSTPPRACIGGNPKALRVSSPCRCQTDLLICSKGSDNYANFEMLLEQGLQESITSLLADGNVETLRALPVRVTFSADMMCLNSVVGLATSAAKHPCVWCCVEKTKLSADVGSTPRTLTQMLADGHNPAPGMVYPWTCACCKTTFPNAAALLSETLSSEAALTKHHQTHNSQRHHQPPLMLDIPMDQRLGDILHFRLRLVQQLFAALVLSALSDATESVMEYLSNTMRFQIKSKLMATAKRGRPPLYTSMVWHLVIENGD
jgi:hypothetical protein